MSKLTRAGAITVAIFSSIGVAAGQNVPSPTTVELWQTRA